MTCTVGLTQHGERIKSFFEDVIDNYDLCTECVVPKNGEVHDTVVALLPFSRDDEFKVVDLGTGTGMLALKVLRAFPNSRVVGVDFSRKMLDKAAENLHGFKDRTEFIQDSFENVELPHCDAVVSTTAIHNVEDEIKKALFKKIAGALGDGGRFVNGDFIRLENPALQRRADDYLALMRQRLSGNELRAWTKHAVEEDKPVALKQQFEWLKQAGFSEAESVWKHYNLSVYSAKK